MRINRVGVGSSEPIGRDGSMEIVLGLLRSGGVTCLVGEAGVGKTTIWNACLDRVTPDWRWTARCVEAEKDLGLTVLADLFAAVPDEIVDALPSPQRRAIDVVLLRAEAGEHITDGRVLGATMNSLLGMLAERGTILLAVDDLHWCDQASLTALRFALRRVDSATLSFFGTRRVVSDAVLPNEREVPIDPLPLADVVRLLDAAGLHLPARVARRVVDISRGNPLYALELSRPRPGAITDIKVPSSLSSLLAQRFTGLKRPCWEAMLDLAVSGSCDSEGSLAQAYERGIVVDDGGSTRVSHPLLGELVKDRATPHQLRSAHLRAAAASADAVERARHLAGAARGPDEATAEALDTAVLVAQRRGDLHGARDLAELACTMTPPGGRFVPRLAALARCEGGLGRERAARDIATDLLGQATNVQDRFLALMILADTPPATAALDYAAQAAALPGLDERDRLAAICLRAKVLFVCGHCTEATQLISATLAESSSESPAREGLTAHLAVITRLSGRRHDDSALERAVELDRRGALVPSGSALEIAGLLSLFDDRHADARRLFRDAGALFAARGHSGYAVDQVLAMLECRVGNLALAHTLAIRAFESDEHRVREGDAATLALVCAWQGDSPGVMRAVEAVGAVDRDRVGIRTRATLAHAEGFLALLNGEASRAWTTLRGVVQELETLGLREPSYVPALPDAIEAAVAVGELAEAEQLCSRLESQAQSVGSRWGSAGVLRSLGHIAAARGDDDTALERFDQSASAYEQLALPLERGRAILAAATRLRRIGRRANARERLLVCESVFASSGACRLLEISRSELARIGGKPQASRTALTDAERPVAELAASGLRNAEIATRLQIAPKTVESHLGTIYRKLGLRGRAELANARHNGLSW